MRDSVSISLNYSAKTDKLYKKYGNEQLIRLIPFSIPAFGNVKTRKLPVQLNFPIYKEDSIEYAISNGFKLEGTLRDIYVSSEYGDYKIKFNQKNNKVMVIKSFYLKAGNYSLSQYADFYNFILKVSDIENNTYIITKKQE